MEQVHDGTEEAENQHTLALCLAQFLASCKEFLHFFLFPVENLGDLDAGEIFRQERIQLRTGIGDAPVGFPGEFLEDGRKQHHKGNEAGHHQCHGEIHRQHGGEHAENHHAVFHHGHQNVGEQHADAVGIVGDASHQLAHGNVVQLFVGQALDVGEHVLTQVGQDLLSHLL